MLDINQYTYVDKPFESNHKFSVMPLNDTGVRQYYEKEAHTHTFLDPINPRKMRQIYEEKRELDDYMKTILNEREARKNAKLQDLRGEKQECSPENNQQQGDDIHDQLQNEDGNLENHPQDNQYNQPREEVYDSTLLRNEMNQMSQMNQENNFGRTCGGFGNSYRSNFGQPQTTRNYDPERTGGLQNTTGHSRYGCKRPFQKLDEKLAYFGDTNFGKLNKVTVSKNPRNYSFSSQKTRYSNTNFNETYSGLNKSLFRANKKKIGFESFNVPRVENYRKPPPIYFDQFNNKCMNSVSNFFKQPDQTNESFYNYLDQENSRLTNIMLNQTSEGFLKANKLPKISYIVNQPEIVVKKTGIGNSKYMGQNFNPHNFQPNNAKNLTKRNVYGSLFQH